MIEVVESKRGQIDALCRRHQVKRLYLIGSAARDDFDPSASDLDFVVVFNDVPRRGFDDVYFQLKDDLVTLFDRSVDLIEFRAIRNPYFKEEVIETRVPLYAA